MSDATNGHGHGHGHGDGGQAAVEKQRVFLRGIVSGKYALQEFRRDQMAAPRVRQPGAPELSDPSDRSGEEGRWSISPEDEQFLTQTIQVHFVEVPPGGANRGHGHQNEAMFYVLQGHGHEVHDGQRYDWEAGDVVVVHTDSVHRHFNDSETEPAVSIVMKAKSMWMYFGLVYQGKIGTVAEGDFGPREDWSQLWTPGVTGLTKVVRGKDTPWELTERGRVKRYVTHDRHDVRLFSVETQVQEIEPGGHSSKRWQMADEVAYVLSGSGVSHQWEVRADLDDRYYARIAREPTTWTFGPGDTVYVPQNTINQYRNTGDEPLRLLMSQNRLFRYLGYDREVHLEPASVTAGAEVVEA